MHKLDDRRDGWEPLNGLSQTELGVGIVIGAIFMGVFVSTIVQNKSLTSKQICSANEKRIGIAILQYTEDYDGVLPNRGRGPLGGYPSWKSAISIYLSSDTPGVFRCPSNPRRMESDFDERAPISYAANRGNGNNEPFVDPGDKLASVPLSRIKDPSRTIGIVESTARCTDMNVTNSDMYSQPTGSGTKGNLFAGHGGCSNYLFIDGHVQTMKPLETLDQADGGSGTVNMWTIDLSSFAAPRIADQSDATGATVLKYATARYANINNSQ